jgi:hypothetical protein
MEQFFKLINYSILSSSFVWRLKSVINHLFIYFDMLQSPADAQVNKNRRKMVDKGQVTDDIAQDHRAQCAQQAESQSQNDAQNENGTSTFKVWGCMHIPTRHPFDNDSQSFVVLFVHFKGTFCF